MQNWTCQMTKPKINVIIQPIAFPNRAKMSIVVNLTILVILLLQHKAFASDSDFIRCPLQWTSHSFGEEIPSDAIQVSSSVISGIEMNYIARSTDGSGGRVEKGNPAYTINGTTVAATDAYEILTNPFKCLTSWTQDIRSIHAVEFTNGEKVGKIVSTRHGSVRFVYPGIVKSDNRIHYVDPNLSYEKTTASEVLTSYSRGLKLQMVQFKFTQNLFSPYKEFLGVDEIYNEANTIVKQSVTHRKRTVEKFKLVTHSSWGHAFDLHFNYKPEFTGSTGQPVSGPDIKFTYNLTYTTGSTKTIETEKEVEIEVMRAVEVPAYTSVSICSTVDLVENFELDYTCKGRYSAPGLTSTDIVEILAKDGISGIPEGDAVMVDMSGTMGGGIALATQFIILPINDPDGCSKIAGEIREFNNLRKSGHFDEVQLKKMQEKINRMIQLRPPRQRQA